MGALGKDPEVMKGGGEEGERSGEGRSEASKEEVETNEAKEVEKEVVCGEKRKKKREGRVTELRDKGGSWGEAGSVNV